MPKCKSFALQFNLESCVTAKGSTKPINEVEVSFVKGRQTGTDMTSESVKTLDLTLKIGLPLINKHIRVCPRSSLLRSLRPLQQPKSQPIHKYTLKVATSSKYGYAQLWLMLSDASRKWRFSFT